MTTYISWKKSDYSLVAAAYLAVVNETLVDSRPDHETLGMTGSNRVTQEHKAQLNTVLAGALQFSDTAPVGW